MSSNGTTPVPEFSGYTSPNYTQVPDELFDRQLPDLTGAELKVLLYIMRRTFGWKKDSDNISLKQMVEGITKKDGTIQDRGAGLSKSAAAKAVKGLIAKGVIVSQRDRSPEKGNEPTTYAVRFKATGMNGLPAQGDGNTPLVHQEDKGGVHLVDKPLSTRKTYNQHVLQPTDSSKFEKEHTQEFDEPATTSVDSLQRPPGASKLSRRASPQEPPQTPVVGDPATNAGHPADPVRPPPVGEGYQRFREQGLPGRAVPLGEILKLRREAATIGQGGRTKPGPAPAQPIAADRPARTGTGRLKGTAEERERLRAYLGDFAAELGDEASLASSITRALNLFRQANVPPELWGDHLYQARAITQEHTAQITKQSSNGRAIRRKNKMPYFFEVLEDLVGLRPEGSSRSGGSVHPR